MFLYLEMPDFSFSILIASYNSERYIKTAIDSVLSQTYHNWELIIVDDFSLDDTKEVIKKFLNDNKIKFISHKRNLGYGGALRTAAIKASREVIGILDADDKLHNEALKIMNKAYNENPDCGFIYSTMWVCDFNLKNCKISKSIGTIIPKKSFIFKPNNISHFKTFKRHVYLKTVGFEINQKRAVDKDIIYKLEEVTKFKFINLPLYYYREHSKGISQGKNEFITRKFHLMAKYKTYLRRKNTNLPNFSKIELFFHYFFCKFRLFAFFVNLLISLKIPKIINKQISHKFHI